MGTKGKKNVPITARVNAGLFNQKKGVTEPVLNVGPAGVYGNNQTRDIPSPSKKRGYVMKASPFKQVGLGSSSKKTDEDVKPTPKPKANEGDIKVITTKKTPDTTKEITVKGKDTEVYTPPKRTKEGDEAYAKLTPEQRKAQDDKYKKKNTKIVKGKDEKKTVTVKGKETKREKPVQTRDSEDTQTARERSNTVRGGKRMNRKEKNAAIKEAKAQAKVNGLTGKERREYVKDAKNKAKLTQAQKNKKLAAASGAGAQRQAEQNKSISARKTGTVKSNERNLRESDMTSDTKKKLVDKQLGVKSETTKKTNPSVAGVSDEDIKGTGNKSKKGRFAGKSKMKKKK